jgi:predicted DNA-binding protein with PD1-like motif
MIRGNCEGIVVCKLPHGEDVLEAIENAATKADVRSGVFSLIGALEKARLGFYSEEGRHEPIDIDRQLEITSCMGNLADEDGRLAIHAHMTVADSEGRVYGGHVLTGCRIYIRAELMIFEMEGAKLKRKIDETTGLHILQD